jgi:hypothetical protein
MACSRVNFIFTGSFRISTPKAWVLYSKDFEQTKNPTAGSQLRKFKKLVAVWK